VARFPVKIIRNSWGLYAGYDMLNDMDCILALYWRRYEVKDFGDGYYDYRRKISLSWNWPRLPRRIVRLDIR
jgi:hypothetical protein